MAEIGIVGLGKMGANMAERLRRAGHEVVGFDHDKYSSRDVANLGELVQALPTPRVVWVMVPAGEPTYATVRELQGLSTKAMSWSTAATRATPTISGTQQSWPAAASGSLTRESRAGSGD